MTVELELHGSKIDTTFPEQDVRVQVGFNTPYAAAVNYGAEPHWPPLRPMVKWTNRMGWENYGLTDSMSEDDLWAEVDRRRAEGMPQPAGYLMAAHIAEHGTKPMMYASDAFTEAQQKGESWLSGREYDADTPLVEIAEDFANWSLELAVDNLQARQSSAATGTLQTSFFPAQVIEK
jgi:hypothetical protein